MSESIDFYTNPMSRGRIVRWMLEECAANYQAHVLEYGSAMKSAEFLAINPMGKVPAIVHGANTVTECAAICAYLADIYPEKKLAPQPAERSEYYRWLFFAAGPLEAAVTNHSLDLDIPSDKSSMLGYGSLANVLDVLEDLLTEGTYLCADHFTAADVYLGSQIGFGLQFGSIEKRPAFENYFQMISDRKAYRKAVELDDALMPTS